MRQISFWTFIAYYGTLYLVGIVILVLGFTFGKDAFTPIMSLIFPIAKDNSLFKLVWTSTVVYWPMVLIWEMLIQRTKLTDCPWDKGPGGPPQ